MFIFNPSLECRIALFGFVLIHLILPGNLDFLERGFVASLVVSVFFWQLPSVTIKGYQPEGWLMWLDIALSWIMLLSYSMVLVFIVSEGLNLGTFFVSVLALSFAGFCASMWYGFIYVLNDEGLLSEA